MSRKWRRRTVEQHVGKLLVDLGREQREAQQLPPLREQLIAAGLLEPGGKHSSTDNLAGPTTRKPGTVAADTSSPRPVAVPGSLSNGAAE